MALYENAFNKIERDLRAEEGIASIAENKLQDLDDFRQSLLQKAFAGELT